MVSSYPPHFPLLAPAPRAVPDLALGWPPGVFQSPPHCFRRLTLGSRVSVVSLLDPGFPSSHSWFRIPAHFFVKNFWKIRKINFSDSRDQNKITKFLWFFYMTSISYINPLFRAPSPPNTLKSRPRYQNLPGDPLRAQSDHRGPVSAQFYGLCCLILTLSHLKLSLF